MAAMCTKKEPDLKVEAMSLDQLTIPSHSQRGKEYVLLDKKQGKSKKLSKCSYLLLRGDGSAHRDDEVTEKVECRVVEDVRFGLEHLDKQLELVHLGFWQRRHLAPIRVRVGVHGSRHTDV